MPSLTHCCSEYPIVRAALQQAHASRVARDIAPNQHRFGSKKPTTCPGSKTSLRPIRAFTLIELLIVISVIALISAMIFPAIRTVDRIKRVSRARSELAQVESLVESYKTKLGHYPPDNRNPLNSQLLPGLNQLYYELDGTIFTNGNEFIDKDMTAPPLTAPMITSFFGPGVSGFVNSDRGNSDESGVAGQFLRGLKPGQVATVSATNSGTRMTVTARLLVCSVPGPDPNTPPLNNSAPPLNPWRYNSSAPTNNSSTYDLWIDIYLDGKTNRISNWASRPVVVY